MNAFVFFIVFEMLQTQCSPGMWGWNYIHNGAGWLSSGANVPGMYIIRIMPGDSSYGQGSRMQIVPLITVN